VATMLQTSNIVWQSVCLTDELKINLEYDIHRGLLNIFVKNTSDNKELPCHINVLSEEISNPRKDLLATYEMESGLCLEFFELLFYLLY
jgi:hypothetical protein